MPMEVVYLETSFISLLVANPSRDLATAGQQQTTRDWWQLPTVCTPLELMGDPSYEIESDS
jgi:hypothetical protein